MFVLHSRMFVLCIWACFSINGFGSMFFFRNIVIKPCNCLKYSIEPRPNLYYLSWKNDLDWLILAWFSSYLHKVRYVQ